MDLDLVEQLIANAITPQQHKAYTFLHDLLYGAYIKLLSSEV